MTSRRHTNLTSQRRRTASITSPAAGFRSLVARGFAPDEAGNLTALVSGLRPAEKAWSVAEINRLQFLLYRISHGQIEP